MPKITKQMASNQVLKPSSNYQSAWDLSSDLTMLLYGESGTGKTTLWATFPGPIRTFVCSGASRSGELRSIDTSEYRQKIFPEVINHTDRICDAIEELDDSYRTVVLDHVSGLLGLILKENLGLNDLPAVKKWGMAKQAEWGQINEKCIEILRNLLGLPTNVVIVGQERIFRGKEDGNSNTDIIKPSVGASVTPGVAGWLNPACDYIVQTFIRPKMIRSRMEVGGKEVITERRGKGMEYCLRTEPHDLYTIKFRRPKGNALPEVLINPTYDTIVALIRGQ